MKSRVVIVDSQIRSPESDGVFCNAQKNLDIRYPALKEFGFGYFDKAFFGMLPLTFIEIDLDNQSDLFDILHSVRRMADKDAYLAVLDYRLRFFTGYSCDISDKMICIMHRGDEEYMGITADSEIYE